MVGVGSLKYVQDFPVSLPPLPHHYILLNSISLPFYPILSPSMLHNVHYLLISPSSLMSHTLFSTPILSLVFPSLLSSPFLSLFLPTPYHILIHLPLFPLDSYLTLLIPTTAEDDSSVAITLLILYLLFLHPYSISSFLNTYSLFLSISPSLSTQSFPHFYILMILLYILLLRLPLFLFFHLCTLRNVLLL